MNSRLVARWEAIRSSYWFIPSLMALGAVALAFGTTRLDIRLGNGWMDGIGWLVAHRPDGARAVLSTIAGSMITVAGVTFSITIAAVSYASGQFGPRILANFMRDRGNQVTLGTFIATFLYCLLVLRAVRSPEEGGAGDALGFVPQSSILVAIGLAIASIGVLIFFIHHVPARLHLPNIVATIGHELDEHLDAQRYPTHLGDVPDAATGDAGPLAAEQVLHDALPNAACVRADGTGYLQHVDAEDLLHLAEAHDLVIRVIYRPGDFVGAGRPLLFAWPAGHVDDDCIDELRRAFAWGRQRTYAQDLLFLIDELVEIAGRALSSGINDPFTAMNCMDWLGHALVRYGRHPAPSARRYGEDGRLRIITHPTTFGVVAEHAFAQLRPYAAGDRNAALYLMKVLADTAAQTEDASYRRVLLRHGEALRVDAQLANADDRAEVARRFGVLARLVHHPEARDQLAERHRWLGGSA